MSLLDYLGLRIHTGHTSAHLQCICINFYLLHKISNSESIYIDGLEKLERVEKMEPCWRLLFMKTFTKKFKYETISPPTHLSILLVWIPELWF